MWFNIGTEGRLLLLWYRQLKFHNWWRTYWSNDKVYNNNNNNKYSVSRS
jgi:hypothetical protein